MSTELVSCVVEGGVATITLSSPANRNALSRPLVDDLSRALDRAEADDVRVVVLTHDGGTFCAGADLKERLAGPVDSSPLVSVFRRLMRATSPTIAAVDGAVRAGGIGLMACCDLVVARDSVDFAFTEVRIGAAPAMIAVPILRRCSAAQVGPYFLTGEVFDAHRAHAIGLVTHVVPDVSAQVTNLVAAVLRGAPGAVAATKQILLTVPGEQMDAALDRMQQVSENLFNAPEAAEGMRALFDRSTPSWVAMPPSGRPAE